MGYHPETLVFSFPPYPRKSGLAKLFYRLSPWIGFDVWHIDPETPGTGQRRDDSCGWFDRRPREYADAVNYLLGDQSTVHEINLILARKIDTPAPFYEGISERHISYPRLPAADCLALCLMVARGLELRRWWNGQDGKGGAHASWFRRTFTRKRNVGELAYNLALNPIDNLSTVESHKAAIGLIAGALGRNFKPWWKHPRWHIHHWKINFKLPRNLKRMVQPCTGCGERLGFGYCPTSIGGKYYHHECAGHSPAEAA